MVTCSGSFTVSAWGRSADAFHTYTRLNLVLQQCRLNRVTNVETHSVTSFRGLVWHMSVRQSTRTTFGAACGSRPALVPKTHVGLLNKQLNKQHPSELRTPEVNETKERKNLTANYCSRFLFVTELMWKCKLALISTQQSLMSSTQYSLTRRLTVRWQMESQDWTLDWQSITLPENKFLLLTTLNQDLWPNTCHADRWSVLLITEPPTGNQWHFCF